MIIVTRTKNTGCVSHKLSVFCFFLTAGALLLGCFANIRALTPVHLSDE